MSKQPKLVLRESAVHDLSRDWPAGTFVEMGAGTGHMARLFLARGFTGTCHDLGEDNRQRIRQNLASFGPRAAVVDDIAELPDDSFDYLLAFEVLEHIEADRDVLATWVRKLRPGGRLLISVPAHQRKYGRSDELVGHVRRYEREQLLDLLRGVGIRPVRLVNYGWPLTELTRRVSNRLVRDDHSYDGMNPEQRSVRSAQAKPKVINRLLSLTGSGMFRPFCFVQRWFYRYDLGDGLVVSGIKDA
jgi:SAM-dependent methyltransferase